MPQTARDSHACRETARIPVGANPVCCRRMALSSDRGEAPATRRTAVAWATHTGSRCLGGNGSCEQPMGSREYGIDFSPGGLGPRGGGKAPIRILGRNEDCPVGGSTRCSAQGGSGPGRGCRRTWNQPSRNTRRDRGQAAQAGLLHTGAAGQEPEGGHGQDQPGPVHAGRIRAARARPRPAHAPGVRKPCSTGPASRRRRGPRPR